MPTSSSLRGREPFCLPDGDLPDHDGDGLVPCDPAQRRDQRHEHGQGHKFLDRSLEMLDDKGRDRSREQAEEQEREPLLDGGEGAVLDPVAGVQRYHLVHVFGGLFVNDIDDVVDCDHPHELVLRVHNRDGHQVVVRHLPGHLLLVSLRLYVDHILGHDVLQRRVGPGKQQLPQGYYSLQVILVIDHVEVEGGFHIALQLHGCDGVGDIGVLVEGVEVWGHDSSRGFLLVVEKLHDLFGRLLCHSGQDRIFHLFGQQFEDGRDIVGGRDLHDVGYLIDGEVFQDGGGVFGVQFAQDLCCLLFVPLI